MGPRSQVLAMLGAGGSLEKCKEYTAMMEVQKATIDVIVASKKGNIGSVTQGYKDLSKNVKDLKKIGGSIKKMPGFT